MDRMNSIKDISRMKIPVFATFKYWDERHDPRDI